MVDEKSRVSLTLDCVVTKETANNGVINGNLDKDDGCKSRSGITEENVLSTIEIEIGLVNEDGEGGRSLTGCCVEV